MKSRYEIQQMANSIPAEQLNRIVDPAEESGQSGLDLIAEYFGYTVKALDDTGRVFFFNHEEYKEYEKKDKPKRSPCTRRF